MKKGLLIFTSLLALAFISILSIDAYVTNSVKKQMTDNIQTIHHNRVGLVLGTSKYVATNTINLYYKYRIEAALELYKEGKIDFIIVSGDNSSKNYNEPKQMMEDIVKAGVPEDHVYLDYAGFRTLDSIVRCKAIFNATDITVISQKFHNERAIFIANKKGIKAIGYNAQSPPEKYRVKTMLREKLARVKMMLDLLFNKQPKFYGEPIHIGVGTPQPENA